MNKTTNTNPTMDEIINKVANSPLITIDLEDYFPKEEIVLLDISQWLDQGFILREKEFRQALKEHDWSKYKNKWVALTNEKEAILPSWAFLLISTYLNPMAKKARMAKNQEAMLDFIYKEVMNDLPMEEYKDQRLILKGCANKPVPPNAYLFLLEKLQPIAKSVMYGEACSTVPLYKKP